MAKANDAAEDFVTCGVCLWEYDEEIRRPKFLPCSHTVCLECLKEIRRADSITCPFCRKVVTKDANSPGAEWILPNNFYALQLLKLNKQKAVSRSNEANSPLKNKNIEDLVKLKEELLKMRDAGTNKLALAIQKRKEIEEHLELVIKSIRAAEEEAIKCHDENNFGLAELISILETNARLGSNTFTLDKETNISSEKDFVLLELLSLVEGSTSEDTAEVLTKKMTESIELYERKLTDATAVASKFELRQKTKVQVHLSDERHRPIQTCAWLEEGFRFQPLDSSLSDAQVKQDSLLIYHAVFSALERQKIPLKNVQKSTASALLPTPTAPVLPTVSAKCKFIPGNLSAKFILRLFQSGRLKGEIHIRPVPTFHPDFVQKLGDFCYKSPKNFSSVIDKAMSGVYVQFSMIHPQFQPEIPSMIGHGSKWDRSYDSFFNLTANEVDDVGITLVKSSATGKITGWNFVFVLVPNEDFHRHDLHETVTSNEFFGRVMDHKMLEHMVNLSTASKYEREKYIMTLESQS
ncbi:uncharacterized protein LOC124326142 isoform X2 [Daphnia pulicaria]|uniref:uncharacterized protein LOC124326142 isoform X2 n=1 Tax=Daphnia pulicaria TaxID=35523 RepID=UPI001EEB7110|nr:uncharacterized protein LOC124326142 isoform X2 [Daphnia pulicaria]